MQTQLLNSSKISVIAPIYNGARHILAHYHSICAGLKNYNFEIIYCDNNSFDNSFELIGELSKNDPRVIATSCAKRGASSARNTALNRATGGVLIFLDIDDRVLPDGLTQQINIAFGGVASYSVSLMDSNNPSLYPVWKTTKKLNFWLNFGNQGALSAFVTPNNPLRFDESLRSSEDWLYIVSVRQFLKEDIVLVKSVCRMYDAETGYSSALDYDLIKRNHMRALSSYYKLTSDDSEFLFNLIYSKIINIKALFILLKIYISKKHMYSLYFLNLIRLLIAHSKLSK